MIEIKPQKGYQTDFLSSSADIVIGGGAAGAGKTWSLLFEPCRHSQNPLFGGVIFRRTYPQITNEGGLWDASNDLYPLLGAEPKQNSLEWVFNSGARLKFSHIQHEKNIFDYQGSEIPFIAFDELTHFSEKMFFYLLSRNRSTSGIRPYVRATCNPDPESWVARLLEWWIDQDTGYPIAERSGVIRYFTRDNGVMVWGNSAQEVIDKCPHLMSQVDVEDKTLLIKSITFIPGTIYHNQELLKKNPQYLGDLMAQDEATKMQLLHGNWKVKIDAESMIDYAAMLDAFTNEHVVSGKRFITADIALHGSDNFVMYVWDGWRVIDAIIIDKSDGLSVEKIIKETALKYSVSQSSIAYDADGIGAFLKGYLQTAYSFNNGGKCIGNNNNYKNLKTQCYYLLAEKINGGKLFISEKVANQKINNKFVRDIIIAQSRAIKKHQSDSDGKLMIIPKEQMKNILGCSPDYLDALMMRCIFDLKVTSFTAPKIKAFYD